MSEYQIYVDGTYNQKDQTAGYGFIVFNKRGDIVHVQKGRVYDYLESWQISAELIGALRVMEWCYNSGIKKFSLYFDYNGIGDFVNGVQIPRQDVCVFYERSVAMYQSYGLDIDFNWIKRKYNVAHKIASDAIFETDEVIISGDGYESLKP